MRASRRAFTLIELLVTSSMLALLAAAGYAAFNVGVSASLKTRRVGDMVAAGQAALQVMAHDLMQAADYKPEGQEDPVGLTALNATYEARDADTADFIVPAARRSELQPGMGAWCEVSYYIDNDPETDARGLIRRQDDTLDDDPLEGGTLSCVSPWVSEMNLEFYDGIEWKSEWIGERKLPEAVRVRLVVVDRDEIEKPMVFSTVARVMAR